MTNHIEEMMRTAGVEGIRRKKDCQNCPYFDYKGCVMDCLDFEYPDFSAEKQLEIIKLIGIIKDFICEKDFAQSLAKLTTELMNKGELDKQKVKEILEG